MKKLLITTSIIETWLVDCNYEKIFISESARIYSRKDIWNNDNYKVFPYHWNNKNKFHSDYTYLNNLYDRLLLSFTEKLNFIHGVSYSQIYWRIIIGPWLINYIAILFDKHEQISIFINQNKDFTTVDLDVSFEDIQPLDYLDFIDKIQLDEWNYYIYINILKELYPNNNYLKVSYDKKYKITKERVVHKNYKEKFKNLFDIIISRLSFNKNYFFHTAYFNVKRYILLNISLGQIPQNNEHYFTYTTRYNLNKSLRIGLLGLDYKNQFEKYIDKFIFKDIPISYLENYKNISNFIDKIKINPKNILSANSYWSNDIFKVWLAKMKYHDCKIFILDHGGAFPLLYSSYNHEEIISDNFIIWFIPYSKYYYKQVQLPANKLNKILTPDFNGSFCSYIGFESVRYGYKLCSQPMNIQVLYHFDDSLKLYNGLKDSIKEFFLVRPYTEMGWMTKQRYIDILGNEKVVSDEQQNYNSFIKNSKLVICSYPQTTFTESMISGIPTILFYNPIYNESVHESQFLIKILLDANIIFHCPNKAAIHINNIWDKIDEWWLSEKVVNARSLFFQIAIKGDQNFIKEWYKFLKTDISN
jgi:putative transferase (TIGR04331 family)